MERSKSSSRDTVAILPRTNHKKTIPQVNACKSLSANYFSTESFLVLIFITASLLILPLILPPLPPPPFMLLLLPMAIFIVLLVLALRPYDVRDIASSYL